MPRNNPFLPLKEFVVYNQKKIILGLKLLLIGIIVFIEWKLNNRFFALFIVLFSLGSLIFYNRRYFILIITTILVFLVFNTSTLNYLLMIKQADVPALQHPKAIINTLFTPNTGREVLPNPVQIMVSIIQELKITDYKLSPEITDNMELMQRIIESAWPVKLEVNSPYTFITQNERLEFQNCTFIKQIEDVILVSCP